MLLFALTAAGCFIVIYQLLRDPHSRFEYIVIHHTASERDDLESIRKLHMTERNWSDIAYHFVIGNGSLSGDGEIQESGLWKKKEPNFATLDDDMNRKSIAIVLVGNFEKKAPGLQQKKALLALLARLSLDYGIPPAKVLVHRQVSPSKCPGKFFPVMEIRGELTETLRRIREN